MEFKYEGGILYKFKFKNYYSKTDYFNKMKPIHKVTF